MKMVTVTIAAFLGSQEFELVNKIDSESDFDTDIYVD